jgi:hypothetical protein
MDVRAALPADGAVLAAWAERGSRSSIPSAAIAPAGLPFAATRTLGPPSAVTPVQALAAGAAAWIAWSSPRGGPVRIVGRAPGASRFGAPRALAAAGDGDILLAAARERAIAAWQPGDRLRLTALAGPR